MAVDLHTHSTMSDGSLAPSQLMEHAAEMGLSALALTDHDTLAGIDEATLTAERVGVRLIPGVELSLEWQPGTLHVVVLFIDTESELAGRLEALRTGRDTRNLAILELLAEMGIEITPEELAQRAGDGAVGRPHIASLLVEKGHAESIGEAFEQFLAKGGPAYVDRARLDPETALHLSREAGGVAVLAHPHTLGLDRAAEIAETLEWLRSIGLIGIEAHYGGYEGFTRTAYVALAEKFDLVPSGGSDFHGDYKPDTLLGTGTSGIPVPDEVLQALEGARP